MLRNLKQRLQGNPQPQEIPETINKQEVTMDNLISFDIKGSSEPDQQPAKTFENLIDFTDKDAEQEKQQMEQIGMMFNDLAK
jgi:hypothetical protein